MTCSLSGRFLQVDGLETRLLEAGAGEAVLLLHPVGFSADIWLRNLPALGASFRVCAPDLLGHGFSSLYGPSGTIGHQEILDHLAALVDRLGFDHFSIAGSSFGAQIGALLYFRMPARVRRLIVIGSASTVEPPEDVVSVLAKTRANAARALATPSWESCTTRLANLCHSPTPDFSDLILSQLTAHARPGAAAAYDALLARMSDPEKARNFSVHHRLRNIALPVLLLWGREDPRARWEGAVDAARLIPDSLLSTLEKCGHLPFFEQPTEFNRIVTDFLSDRPLR